MTQQEIKDVFRAALMLIGVPFFLGGMYFGYLLCRWTG